MYNRKPLPRVRGKYAERLENINRYAEKVADELADLYPDVDIIDIEFQFEASLRFALTMKRNGESAEEV